MGKLVFLDLVDRSGRIQLICPTERTGELDLHLGDVVGVTGSPAQSRRGEPSLQVDELEVLARIRAPLPDTFHGIEDVELRYRKRYLDLLMSEESRDEAIKRARMVSAIRAYLDGEGFLEVETPILQPRYGGGFAEPFVTRSELLDADLYLRIADELYLKRLIVGGLEKVYELSKDFRNESYSYKHSPEFTQVEWYEAYADYKDTAARLKELVRSAAEAIDRRDEDDLPRPRRRPRAVAGGAVRRGARRARRLDARRGRAAREADRGGRRRLERPQLGAARRPRVLPLRRAGADPADDRLRLADRAVPVRPHDRRRRDARRALRGRRERDGDRERLQRAQRLRGAGAALRDAGVGAGGGRRRGRAGRPGLRRGDVVRDGAERRLRRRHRPARDGAAREGHDPRRDPLPGACARATSAGSTREGHSVPTEGSATMGAPSTVDGGGTTKGVEGLVRTLH